MVNTVVPVKIHIIIQVLGMKEVSKLLQEMILLVIIEKHIKI